MSEAPPPEDRERFYRAALIGLRFFDAQQKQPTRFGSGPDARWSSFAGHLHAGDRIDLLCRDASVSWGPAFSAAVVFGFEGVAPDEPFGPEWPGLEDRVARRLWAEAEGLPAQSASEALEAAHRALVTSSGTAALPDAILPSSKLAVAGLDAIAAVGARFIADDTLRWEDQVVVVADQPAERQLGGLVALLCGAGRPSSLAAAGPAPDREPVVSSDASDTVRRALTE